MTSSAQTVPTALTEAEACVSVWECLCCTEPPNERCERDDLCSKLVISTARHRDSLIVKNPERSLRSLVGVAVLESSGR